MKQAAIGRLIGSEERAGVGKLQTWQKYDEHNRLTNQTWKTLDNIFRENYNYDTHGRLTKKTTILPDGTNSAIQINYGDALGWLSTVKTPVSTDYYNYLAGSGSNTTTPLVSAMSHNPNGNSLSAFSYRYEYDALGNITKITAQADSEIDQISSYTYDSQSQLLSESYYSGYASYTYDTYGNIRTKEVLPQYDDEVLYAYNYGNSQWRDLLTSIKITKNGTSSTYNYTYDAIGNPRQYYNIKNNATWSLRWIDGRSLHQAVGGGSTVDYQYGADNLRTKKTVDGVVHNYIYAGGKLLRESYTKNGTSYVLDFVYDQNGWPYMLYLKKGTAAPEVFYYLLNLQEDVVRLVTATGETAAEYRYDAWGKSTEAYTTSGSTVQNLAAINPLRYRGYYYDTETGWYYLQSRYYDPGLGRFINADCYTSTGQDFIGCNMFVYALNNPIRCSDPTGSVAGIDDLIILAGAIFLMAAFEVVLVDFLYSPAAQEAVNDFAVWINNAFYDSIKIETIRLVAPIVAAKVGYIEYSKNKNQSNAVARADARIKSTVRRNSETRYWTANVRIDRIDIGRPLTFWQAVKEVAAGRSVFAVTSFEAKAVARAAGGRVGSNNHTLLPEIHKVNTQGYYYHYHTYNRSGGHVYYLF